MSSREVRDEARRWLRFAREDLESAEALLSDDRIPPRHVCWLAQQGAEKALKGALASQQTPFPFRHDLDALRNLLPGGFRVRERYVDLASLTEWAVEARYPGDWPEATAEDARRATKEARGLYDCVLQDLIAVGFPLAESDEPE